MDIKQLIENLFQSRDQAHLVHLFTDSYAAHVALEEYYTELVDLIDSLAEAYQGETSQLLNLNIKASNTSDLLTFISVLQNLSQRIQNVPTSSYGTQNIIDDIDTLIKTTIYKLKFLK